MRLVVTRILGLVLLVTLLGSGAAWAGRPAHKPPHAKPHVVRAAKHSRHVRKGPIHHRSKAAAIAAAERTGPRDEARFHDQGEPPGQPGLFKSKDSAGWGFDDGREKTVLGLYKRPDHPDIPDNQVYRHDGRGAAGLSLSFKLGK
jgi:hypothetical protein